MIVRVGTKVDAFVSVGLGAYLTGKDILLVDMTDQINPRDITRHRLNCDGIIVHIIVFVGMKYRSSIPMSTMKYQEWIKHEFEVNAGILYIFTTPSKYNEKLVRRRDSFINHHIIEKRNQYHTKLYIRSKMDGHKDEMIQLNVCGTIIETSRSTLTHIPDSFLARQFAARWKESLMRDEYGRIFLDEDEELVRIILEFLRDKKKENPLEPLRPPIVRDEKKQRFALLLEYYGLTEVFRELPPAYWKHGNFTVLVPLSPIYTTIVSQGKHRIQLSDDPPSDNDSGYAIFDAPLKDDGEGSFWKITPDELGEDEYFCTGIIGNLSPSVANSGADPTACGWLNYCDEYGVYEISKGKHTSKKHIPRWSKGECRFFNFKKDKLTMFSTKTRKKFELNVEIGRDMYIYFDLPECYTYKLTIEPVSEKIGVSIFR